MSPLRAANISGVKPLVVDRRTSAPPAMSVRAISVVTVASAPTSARSHSRPSVAALTLAPFASSAFTTSRLPVRAAIMSGVSPLVCARFGSAPAPSSLFTIAVLAFSQARASGVTP